MHAVSRGGPDEVREHLFEIWRLTTDPDLDFEAKLRRVLEREAREYGLPYGFLTRIDRPQNTQTIEIARGSHDHLQDGEICPLSESYCRETIQQSDGLFHVDDALSEGWTDDPAYERFGFGTYLGARIDIDTDLHGTLCFASSAPREEPLTDPERRLIDHLARWVRAELRTRRIQSHLEQQTQQVEELARVVSHDLRNPLNIAQGQVQLLEDSIREAVQQIDTAHRRMGTIIDQMLVLTRVDEPVEDPQPVELQACVREAWEMVPTEAATIDIAFDVVQIAADRDRLENLLENLFRNAVEHGGEAVTVEVGLTDTGFYVADDGPGIPPVDREAIFEPGYTTDREGFGFGLNIVNRIADAHGWQIAVTESDAGGARFDVTGIEFLPDT